METTMGWYFQLLELNHLGETPGNTSTSTGWSGTDPTKTLEK